MKINIVLPAIGESGGIDVIYKYVELLSNRGHDIVIYKEVKAFNMYRYKNKLKNKIHQCYCTFKCVKEVFKIHSKFDKFVISINNKTVRDADVIIATAWPTAYVINKLNMSKGEKYYFIQGFEIWDNKKLGMESYLLPLKKIVISTWINVKLQEYLKIGPFPVIYNGIDLSKFNNPNKRYKKSNESLQCLMLNHNLPKKGIEYGLKAFEMVKKKYPCLKLVMFGINSSDNLPEYIEYIQKPTKKQLLTLYSESDIFIFPSIEEGWGLTPIEAMACKCAVVGTRTGFVLDIGKEDKNMLISEPEDIQKMAYNLVRLIENRKLLEIVSEQGYKAIKKLDWTNSCQALEDKLSERIS